MVSKKCALFFNGSDYTMQSEFHSKGALLEQTILNLIQQEEMK